MLYNAPFVPGGRYPFTRVQIGPISADVGELEIDDTTHIDQYFTTGHGGGTLTDFKGYTVSGSITAYVAKSDAAPHTISSNLPERFYRPMIRIWTGGFYAEGLAAITRRPVTAAAGRFTQVKIEFVSHGYWRVTHNIVEAP